MFLYLDKFKKYLFIYFFKILFASSDLHLSLKTLEEQFTACGNLKD